MCFVSAFYSSLVLHNIKSYSRVTLKKKIKIPDLHFSIHQYRLEISSTLPVLDQEYKMNIISQQQQVVVTYSKSFFVVSSG